MAELSQLGSQANSGVVSCVPQAPPLPLIRPGWASSPSHGVPVCWWSQGRWAGGGEAGQMVCGCPYLLGVGRQAGAWRSSFTKPALSPLAAGPQESAFLPSCPTKSLPVTTAGAPYTLGPPSLRLETSPGQGCPGAAKQRSPGQQFQEGELGGNDGPACSIGCGCWAGPRLGRR